MLYRIKNKQITIMVLIIFIVGFVYFIYNDLGGLETGFLDNHFNFIDHEKE